VIEFERFEHFKQRCGTSGWCPPRKSSSERRRQGAIIKSGSQQMRGGALATA
jgi:hypothetical protein